MLRRWICLLSQQAASLAFAAVCLLPGLKLRIGNAFLRFMGSLTLEFYLIHGLYVELFDHSFDGGVRSPFPIRNVALYTAVVFILSVPSALLLKKLLQPVRRVKKPFPSA